MCGFANGPFNFTYKSTGSNFYVLAYRRTLSEWRLLRADEHGAGDHGIHGRIKYM